MGLCGLVILFACVRCPPARGKKPFFVPVFCPCFCLSFALCPWVVSSYNRRKKKRPFVGRFSCGGVWFLLLSANIEDCKRLAVSACYCYLVLVCLHSSCRVARDIIKICSICCIRAALAFIDSYFVFHVVFSYRFKPLQTFSNIVGPPAIWLPANSCTLQYFQIYVLFRPSSCIPPLWL